VTIPRMTVTRRKEPMKAQILFPFRLGQNNRNAFAFTIELARRMNSDILALSALELSSCRLANRQKRRNEIYCNLLLMKGYYQGRLNRWNAFDDVNIHGQIVERDLNGAILKAIADQKAQVIVLQQKFFSGTGLYEEILAGAFNGPVTFFLLPAEHKFPEPSPNLIGVMFYQQKRAYFMKLLRATKIIDLPKDKDEFRCELVTRQVV
jgi:hypothetical protein